MAILTLSSMLEMGSQLRLSGRRLGTVTIRTLGLMAGGAIGGALARVAVLAGLDAVLGNSRGLRTLIALVADFGPRVRAATPREAAQAGGQAVTVPLAFSRVVRAFSNSDFRRLSIGARPLSAGRAGDRSVRPVGGDHSFARADVGGPLVLRYHPRCPGPGRQERGIGRCCCPRPWARYARCHFRSVRAGPLFNRGNFL
ncbi:NAD(P)-binding domain-containing protein [Streptomyces sp. NPDC048277]|uniref:NAD(P)-binding domain-containing protein n=1 Tax=Streptomyces sp. NPDC048277 TaxID=3155027 RepID=UPI0033DDBB4E